MKLNFQHSCPMEWSQLNAIDEQSKFCQLCSKKVFDLEKKTDSEIEEIFKKEGDVCAKIPISKLDEWITPFQKVLLAIVISFSGTLFNVEFAYSQSSRTELEVCNEERIVVKGTVWDSDSVEVVIGANISFEYEDVVYSASSDINGDFEISLPKKSEETILRIYFMGQSKLIFFEELDSDTINLGDIRLEEQLMLGGFSSETTVVGLFAPDRSAYNLTEPGKTIFEREDLFPGRRR